MLSKSWAIIDSITLQQREQMDGSIGEPFLNTGVMCDSFHSDGSA